ncbi:hypothetical protein GGQ67_003206 [Rhizobium metallidurans]|uniref:Uncharacterized protein n=2 Tax=Rhizobium metallidurans TaxID=1265931 RepID=A0A7W6CQW9_9HYPH|nr:hypothetical protein [Rhizobium metallidurans]
MQASKMLTLAVPRGADQEEVSRNGLWSALQTHLQGVDGATLAIESEMYRHAQPSFLKYHSDSIAAAKTQP